MKLQVSYGYNTFIIDNLLCVYTAKIRVKLADEFNDIHDWYSIPGNRFAISRGKNGCIIVSYAVTSSITNEENIEIINSMLRTIMHKRIDAKYLPKVKQYSDYNESIYCDLPF
jgi:hypothetical protein